MKIIFTLFIVLFTLTSHSQKVFSVDYASQADVKVFVVDYASQADIKVFFVDDKSQCGWNQSSKKQLFY